MTLTQYLGTGSVSRGKLTINSQLKTTVSRSPYLNDANDKQAVVQGIQNLRDALSKVSGIQWIRPTSSQSSSAFVDSVSAVLVLHGQCANMCRSPQAPDHETPTTGSVSYSFD